MSYRDIGFDTFLTRAVEAVQQFTPTEVDHVIPQLSADKLVEGVISTPAGGMTYDVQKNLIVSDGIIELVRIGLLKDGSRGMFVQDTNGNILIQTTVPK